MTSAKKKTVNKRNIRCGSKVISVVPTGYACGAKIKGFDLRNPFNKSEALLVKKLLYQYQVLIFEKQDLSPQQQIQFTKNFGKLQPELRRRSSEVKVPGYPDVIRLSNEVTSPTKTLGEDWHSDGLAFTKKPHGYTILHCLNCTKGIGDTLFANQYRAFEAMPTALQEFVKKLRWWLPEMNGYVQPLVRTHPQTKKPHLYFAPAGKFICDMSYVESFLIINLVWLYQLKSEFIYRHKWQKGDVVIWENSTLLHRRADRFYSKKKYGLREMNRTATDGDWGAQRRKPEPHVQTAFFENNKTDYGSKVARAAWINSALSEYQNLGRFPKRLQEIIFKLYSIKF